jgi:hypothetical protein
MYSSAHGFPTPLPKNSPTPPFYPPIPSPTPVHFSQPCYCSWHFGTHPCSILLPLPSPNCNRTQGNRRTTWIGAVKTLNDDDDPWKPTISKMGLGSRLSMPVLFFGFPFFFFFFSQFSFGRRCMMCGAECVLAGSLIRNVLVVVVVEKGLRSVS